MITYHHSQDFYHCIFRTISICDLYSNIEKERASFYNFYLVFPKLLLRTRLPQAHQRSIRKLINETPDSYQILPNSRVLYSRLFPLFDMSARSLAAIGFISPMDLEAKQNLVLSDQSPVQPLYGRVREYRQRNANVFAALNLLHDTPLYGAHGLRERLSITEFRYDAA